MSFVKSKTKEEAEEWYIKSASTNTDVSNFAIWQGEISQKNYHSGHYICHAPFAHKTIDDAKVVFSNTAGSAGMQEIVRKLWEMFCTEGSPYRSLFKNGLPKPMIFEDRIIGFSLDVEGLGDGEKDEIHNLLYNFMVMMRMPDEYPEIFKSWVEWCDLGVDPYDAIYLARVVRYDEKMCVKRLDNDGSHWPFNDFNWGRVEGVWKLHTFDFDKFKNGTPNRYKPYHGHTSCWTSELKIPRGIKPRDFSGDKVRFKIPKDLNQTVLKGKFSKKSGYDPNDIVRAFKEFVHNHQEMVKKGIAE